MSKHWRVLGSTACLRARLSRKFSAASRGELGGTACLRARLGRKFSTASRGEVHSFPGATGTAYRGSSLLLATVLAACLAIPALAVSTYQIDTIAGTDSVGDNGPAGLASLIDASGVCADPFGNIYV